MQKNRIQHGDLCQSIVVSCPCLFVFIYDISEMHSEVRRHHAWMDVRWLHGCASFGESGRSHLTLTGCQDGWRFEAFTFCLSIYQQHRGDLTAASASSSALKEWICFSKCFWPSLSLSLSFSIVLASFINMSSSSLS